MKFSLRWLYPTAFFCLLLSGVAGLIYQVVWARYLALLLGHTSYAVVAVLVVFMGGLALGNAYLGRFADRIRRPLALYGWLELGIAAYALVFPVYFELCQSAYLALAEGAAPGSPWLMLLKFVVSVAAILVPTTLMGGTLPILTRLVTESLGELRSRVGSLYFINSLGAVFGVLIADFWWVPAFGLDATSFGGAVLNTLVGVVSLVVSAGMGESERLRPGSAGVVAESASGAKPEGDEQFAAGEWRLAVLAAGVSGFVAMLYEIVWTRLLALALGSSTHAFSIMLVTFIAGIAAGAWWVGRWRGLRRTFDAFGWAELALAVTLGASMFVYHLLPYGFGRLVVVLDRSEANHSLYQALQFLLCFAVMFVPAFCLGMTLPLASRVATSRLEQVGRSVGLVFSVNTVGTVLGAALTGIVLLPVLGLARTFALGVALNLVIAIAVLGRRNAGVRRLMPLIALGTIGLFVGVAQVTLSDLWNRAFSLGLWRVRNPPESLAVYREQIRRVDVRYHRDGAGSTVSVLGWTNQQSGLLELTLRVNGKPDASSRGDLSTQMLLGHIPLILRTNVQEVMVVGIGSGVTCGAVLVHPEVKRLDAVEISPEVRDAARSQFAEVNRRALEDPRTEIVLDDAKSFLKASGRRYDVIISEPSNPWMAGVAGVFTAEFYQACRDSLRAGGLMVQWVHIYESNDDALRTVLATFSSTFPHLTVWQTIPGDLVLVGSATPIVYDLESLRQRFQLPAVNADLQRIDLFRLPVLLGLQLVSDYNAPFLVGTNTPIHSDYFPTLEYLAERAFFARGDATLHEVFNETTLPRPTTLLGDYLARHPLTVADAQSFALFHTSYKLPQPRIIRSIVERWRELAPESTLVAEFSAKLDIPLPVAELEAQRMHVVRDSMMAAADREPEPLRIYSRHLMNAYRQLRSAFYLPPAGELEEVLERLREVDATHRQAHLLRLAEIAWDRGDEGRFMKLTTEAFVPQAGAPRVGRFEHDYSSPGHALHLMIETLWRRGQLLDARLWCDAAREGGYLDPAGRYHNPRLDAVVRKVLATPVPAQGAGAAVGAAASPMPVGGR